MTADTASITYTITAKDAVGVSSAFTKKQTFAKSHQGAAGSAGSDAKTVDLTVDDYSIIYNAAGSSPSPSGNMTLTATSKNFTNGYFKFTGDGISDEGNYSDGSGANADTFTFAIPSSHFASPKSLRVGVAEGDQTEVAFDTISITAVKPGSDGSAGAAGLNSATVSLYRKNTSNSSAPAAFSGTFTYTFATGAVTDGTLNSWTVAVPDLSAGEYAWVRQATASSTASTDSIAHSEFSTAVVHSGVGSDGSSITGAAGNSNALVSLYRVSADGSSAPTAFTGTITYTFSGGGVATDGTLNSWTTTVPTVPQGSYLWIRQATASANTSTDTIAIGEWSAAAVTSASGEDGLTFIMSNSSHTFPASAAGAVSSYSGSGTIIEVYEGATALLYDASSTAASYWKTTEALTNITLGSKTDSGAYLTVGDHSGVADGTDASKIVYTVAGKRANGTAFSVTVQQSFSKSKIGATGTGTDGDDGLRTVQGYLFYEKTTANAPSAPSGTTYTFSTGLVTGTGISDAGTTNTWRNIPNTQDATSDNTFYTIRYFGTEASAAASTITVAYSSVVQHTSFSGVVTFSGGTLTDGSSSTTPLEASDVGSGGSTTIDGGRVTTGTIAAGRVSTDLLRVTGDAMTGGTIGGVTINPSKIFIGTGTYGNANTPFYVDNAGDFSLKDKLTWDQSEGVLSINGAITMTNQGSINIGSFNNNSGFTANQSDAAALAAAEACDQDDGSVGGWSISSTTITSGNITLDNANNYILISD
jgi:hypothetical protein